MALEDEELKNGTEMPEQDTAEAEITQTANEQPVNEQTANEQTANEQTDDAAADAEVSSEAGDAETSEETEAADGEAVDAAAIGYEPVEGETVEEPKKKSKAPIIVVIVIVVLAALCGLTYRFGGGVIAVNNTSLDKFFYNKYNNMGYVDIYSMTIADLIEENNSYAESEDEYMTLESFKERYNLPSDMRGDTNMTAMEYSIPIQTYASEIYGTDFDTLVFEFELDEEDVNDQMTWGEFQGEVRLDVAIGGEEYLDEFKEEYGFGDEITADSKWKDVRTAIDQATKEQWEEYQQMYAEMMQQSEEEDEDIDEDTDVDTDADTDTEEDMDIDAAEADTAEADAETVEVTE